MNRNHKYVLEICCYSPNDVLIADQGGAHRVELCNGFSVGGTTPTIGCLQLAKSLSDIPIYVMIRPRGGNFTYNSIEKLVMLKDAELAIANKADGIVFGALNDDGTIDEEFCKAIAAVCLSIPLSFHRAIDICSKPKEAISFLCALGVKTILTSGAQQTALKGIETIEAWHKQSKGQIQIMAGSGVNAENMIQFAKLGLTHFHSSASIIQQIGPAQEGIPFNAALKNNEMPVVSLAKVAAMVNELNAFF